MTRRQTPLFDFEYQKIDAAMVRLLDRLFVVFFAKEPPAAKLAAARRELPRAFENLNKEQKDAFITLNKRVFALEERLAALEAIAVTDE